MALGSEEVVGRALLAPAGVRALSTSVGTILANHVGVQVVVVAAFETVLGFRARAPLAIGRADLVVHDQDVGDESGDDGLREHVSIALGP